jgi:hypothetical protein
MLVAVRLCEEQQVECYFRLNADLLAMLVAARLCEER